MCARLSPVKAKDREASGNLRPDAQLTAAKLAAGERAGSSNRNHTADVPVDGLGGGTSLTNPILERFKRGTLRTLLRVTSPDLALLEHSVRNRTTQQTAPRSRPQFRRPV